MSFFSIGMAVVAVGCEPRSSKPRPTEKPHTQGPSASGRDSAVNVLRVEARGQEFAWQFFLLADDEEPGSSQRSIGNTLKIPAGTLVHMFLTSTDYVYTLTAPDGQKEIAVPEMVHELKFTVTQEGLYEFRTDPMCGWRFFHDDVQGRMEVESL